MAVATSDADSCPGCEGGASLYASMTPKEALARTGGNVYPEEFLRHWEVERKVFRSTSSDTDARAAEDAKAEASRLRKEGWTVRTKTTGFEDITGIFVYAVRRRPTGATATEGT